MTSFYNHKYVWYLPHESIHKKYTNYEFDGWDKVRGTIDLGKYRNFLSVCGLELEQEEIIQNYKLQKVMEYINAYYKHNDYNITRDAKKFGYSPQDFKFFIRLFKEYWDAGGLLEKWV